MDSMRTYFLQLVIFISASSYGCLGMSEVRQCIGLFKSTNHSTPRSELNKAFETAFSDAEVYKCSHCSGNVIRLFDAYKEAIPKLKEEDFNVLYFATQEWIQNLTPATHFHVQNARGGSEIAQLKKAMGFAYHMVLEHKGTIYDLDFTENPNPIGYRDYLTQYFMTKDQIQSSDGQLKGSKEDLLVFVVPGESYLNTDPAYALKVPFHRYLILTHEPQSLVEVLSGTNVKGETVPPKSRSRTQTELLPWYLH